MGDGFICPICEANYNYAFNFCPDCGVQHKFNNMLPLLKELVISKEGEAMSDEYIPEEYGGWYVEHHESQCEWKYYLGDRTYHTADEVLCKYDCGMGIICKKETCPIRVHIKAPVISKEELE